MSSSQQRRDAIRSRLAAEGHATVKALADALDVSEATVRRDLRLLADCGELELVYGGATVLRRGDYSVRTKSGLNVDAKRVVGQLAADLVADGETLFLDSGTTVFEMVPGLKRKRGQCVIVNSLRLATELGAPREGNVVVIGGQYRPERMDCVGPLALDTLEQLRGFRAFIGADGLSMDFGVTAVDMDSAHLYRMALRHAREAILLVDHSKFQAPSLFKICDFDVISRVVTDRRPPEAWMEFLEARGIEVITPPSPTGESPCPSR
jgi:DeoR/GlpR family transcriptional regulator of sugar metabolism